MGVVPIRPGELSTAPAGNRVRPESLRSGVEAPSVRPTKPVTVSTPENSQEVRMQWDGDNGVVLKFTNKKSGEVVRQIPSEQVLNVVRYIRQLVDQYASNQARPAMQSRREGNHG